MITLPNEYTLRGRKHWRYRILKREGDVVFAEMHRIDRVKKKTADEDAEESDEETESGQEFVMNEQTLEGYEVFVVQKYQERPRPDGKGTIPAKEMPPPDYHWGRYGHSYGGVGMKTGECLKRAEARFQEDLVLQVERLAKRENKVSETKLVTSKSKSKADAKLSKAAPKQEGTSTVKATEKKKITKKKISR